jgi:hypothetical protein
VFLKNLSKTGGVMGKSGKKPRQKLSPRQFETGGTAPVKKEKDWSFDEIARSKTRRTW